MNTSQIITNIDPRDPGYVASMVDHEYLQFLHILFGEKTKKILETTPMGKFDNLMEWVKDNIDNILGLDGSNKH